MVSNIILSSDNLSRTGTLNVETQPAPYNKLYLNTGGQSLQGKKIGLNSINLNYSWPNISPSNNTFSISWPTGAGYTDIAVTIPPYNNLESIDAINNYLSSVMIANGMYVINNNTGNFLYFLQIIENPTIYGVSLSLLLVPTSTPAGYSIPSGFAGWPTTEKTMKFTTDNKDFNKLIGFAKSTVYNGNSSAIVYNNVNCPILTPVSSVNITLNLANNDLALNNDSTIIFSGTSINTSYGSMIVWEPNNIVYYDITSTSNTLVVGLTDSKGNPLYVLDPAIDMMFTVID